MKYARVFALGVLGAVLCCVQFAVADNIPATIGTQHFASGTTQTTVGVLAAVTGQPAPFNAACGSNVAADCSARWTFGYIVPVGDTITGATLTLGIFDIDSAASGDAVALFLLNGTANLTALLNSAANKPHGGTGALSKEYDVLTISIPGADLTDLAMGNATFSLALQGPGFGALGKTNFNGAVLDFSTLNITATPGNMPPPAPEPSTVLLLGMGWGLLGWGRKLWPRR